MSLLIVPRLLLDSHPGSDTNGPGGCMEEAASRQWEG